MIFSVELHGEFKKKLRSISRDFRFFGYMALTKNDSLFNIVVYFQTNELLKFHVGSIFDNFFGFKGRILDYGKKNLIIINQTLSII